MSTEIFLNPGKSNPPPDCKYFHINSSVVRSTCGDDPYLYTFTECILKKKRIKKVNCLNCKNYTI